MQGNKILKRSRSLLFNYINDELLSASDHHDKNDYYMRQDLKDKEGKSAPGNHQWGSSSMSDRHISSISDISFESTKNNQDNLSSESSWPALVTKAGKQNCHAPSLELQGGATHNDLSHASLPLAIFIDIIKAKK